MKGKVENVKCPKMDSPDLIPEGFGRVQGSPGDLWGPLKHPETLEFPGFRDFGKIPGISLYLPIPSVAVLTPDTLPRQLLCLSGGMVEIER